MIIPMASSCDFILCEIKPLDPVKEFPMRVYVFPSEQLTKFPDTVIVTPEFVVIIMLVSLL